MGVSRAVRQPFLLDDEIGVWPGCGASWLQMGFW